MSAALPVATKALSASATANLPQPKLRPLLFSRLIRHRRRSKTVSTALHFVKFYGNHYKDWTVKSQEKVVALVFFAENDKFAEDIVGNGGDDKHNKLGNHFTCDGDDKMKTKA